MMKSYAHYIFIVVMLLFSSCSGVNQAVKGFWSIDRIEYKRVDLLYDIGGNIIIFDRNNCTLPTYIDNLKIKSKRNGTWEITQDGEQYYLTITTGNEIFAGKHKICFKKDYDKKLIKMFITSENLFIECRKGLFNFDKDNKCIDEYLCR